MSATGAVEDVSVARGDAMLAGSVWLPAGAPGAVLLMHPGSGPSNRHDDGYFPPIREHLVTRGIAVAAFDKRGVDDSTGRWEDAGIVAQAADARAALSVVIDVVGSDVPAGLFGHSQGGWVVIEAAAHDPRVRFVVTNSGPGVTPAEQERFAMECAMAQDAMPEGERVALRAHFDLWVAMVHDAVPWDVAGPQLEASQRALPHDPETVMFVPLNAIEWAFVRDVIEYDVVPALHALDVPVLGLFGADDAVVPVGASVPVFRATVRPDLLTIAVLPGGNHRVQHGDPPQFVDGYLDALTTFIGVAR